LNKRIVDLPQSPVHQEIGEEGGWGKVELDNGKKGWIPGKQVEQKGFSFTEFLHSGSLKKQ
jgi:hypothetical protein